VETVITTKPAGPMLKDLAAMFSNIAAVGGMQTILRLRISACGAVNQT
jgi:hypothetical protein